MKKHVNISSIWSASAIILFIAVTVIGYNTKVNKEETTHAVLSENESTQDINIEQLTLSLGKESTTLTSDNLYQLSIGNKLGDSILPTFSAFYTSGDKYNDDVTSKIGTAETLTNYMSGNYSKITDNTDVTEEELNAYIEGYYKNNDTRVLGGNSATGYFTVTVYNPTDDYIAVEEGIVKSIWILNCKNITWEYDGINNTLSYEEQKDLLSSFTEREDSMYSDKEFHTNIGKEDVTIYVTDNELVGIRISY